MSTPSILIFWMIMAPLVGGGQPTLAAQEFATLERCEIARDVFLKSLPKRVEGAAFCVRR